MSPFWVGPPLAGVGECRSPVAGYDGDASPGVEEGLCCGQSTPRRGWFRRV